MDRPFNESRSIEAINADHAWCGRYLYDIQEGLGSISTHKNCLVDTSLFLPFYFAIGFMMDF